MTILFIIAALIITTIVLLAKEVYCLHSKIRSESTRMRDHILAHDMKFQDAIKANALTCSSGIKSVKDFCNHLQSQIDKNKSKCETAVTVTDKKPTITKPTKMTVRKNRIPKGPMDWEY